MLCLLHNEILAEEVPKSSKFNFFLVILISKNQILNFLEEALNL